MTYWIFQGNPDHFNVDRYISEKSNISWSIRQKHFIKEIKRGDIVFIWRSKGKAGAIPGIIAVCELTSENYDMGKTEDDSGYWISPPEKIYHRVGLNIKKKGFHDKDVLKKNQLEDLFPPEKLPILKFKNQTNYKLDNEIGKNLLSLVEKSKWK